MKTRTTAVSFWQRARGGPAGRPGEILSWGPKGETPTGAGYKLRDFRSQGLWPLK